MRLDRGSSWNTSVRGRQQGMMRGLWGHPDTTLHQDMDFDNVLDDYFSRAFGYDTTLDVRREPVICTGDIGPPGIADLLFFELLTNGPPQLVQQGEKRLGPSSWHDIDGRHHPIGVAISPRHRQVGHIVRKIIRQIGSWQQRITLAARLLRFVYKEAPFSSVDRITLIDHCTRQHQPRCVWEEQDDNEPRQTDVGYYESTNEMVGSLEPVPIPDGAYRVLGFNDFTMDNPHERDFKGDLVRGIQAPRGTWVFIEGKKDNQRPIIFMVSGHVALLHFPADMEKGDKALLGGNALALCGQDREIFSSNGHCPPASSFHLPAAYGLQRCIRKHYNVSA